MNLQRQLPTGYDISGVTYQPEGGESQDVAETEGKYSFTMPDKAVKVTVNITPITYTLKLDLQDGDGFTEDEKTITGTVEDLIEFPAKQPTKAGFTFAKLAHTAKRRRQCCKRYLFQYGRKTA